MDDDGGHSTTSASPGDALLANVADIVVRFDRELRHLFVNEAVMAVEPLGRRGDSRALRDTLGVPCPARTFV